jgi:hypothetical protein
MDIHAHDVLGSHQHGIETLVACTICARPRALNIELRRRVLLHMQTAFNTSVINNDKRRSWDLMGRSSLAIINRRLNNQVCCFTTFQPHLVKFPPPKGLSTTTDMLIWLVILRLWLQEEPPAIIQIPDWSVSLDSPWRTSHITPYSTSYFEENLPIIYPTVFSRERENRLQSARLICSNFQ